MTHKPAERSNLLITLGRLLAPLYALAETPTPPSSAEFYVAFARFKEDLQVWQRQAQAFAIVGGTDFRDLLASIVKPLGFLPNAITAMQRETALELQQPYFLDMLEEIQSGTIERIDRIPIQFTARLLDERTPLTAHFHVLDAVKRAKARLHFFDRYLDSSIFDLYLRDLDRSVEVRLVTASSGVKAIEAVGRLAAKEFRDFQIIECTPADMHDRNLRVDEAVYFLGPSVKDVGRYPTNFAPADATDDTHRILDAVILRGTPIK